MVPRSDAPRTRSDELVFGIVLLASGVALRLGWLWSAEGGVTGFVGGGEAARVALSLARDGRFADAFWPGRVRPRM